MFGFPMRRRRFNGQSPKKSVFLMVMRRYGGGRTKAVFADVLEGRPRENRDVKAVYRERETPFRMSVRTTQVKLRRRKKQFVLRLGLLHKVLRQTTQKQCFSALKEHYTYLCRKRGRNGDRWTERGM